MTESDDIKIYIQHMIVDKNYTQSGYHTILVKISKDESVWIKVKLHPNPNSVKYKYICYFEDCDVHLRCSSILLRHYNGIMHNSYNICTICNKIYLHWDNLLQHHALYHSGIDLQISRQCVTNSKLGTISNGMKTILVDDTYIATDGWQIKTGMYQGNKYIFKCRINPDKDRKHKTICHFVDCQSEINSMPSFILAHYNIIKHDTVLYCTACDFYYCDKVQYRRHIKDHVINYKPIQNFTNKTRSFDVTYITNANNVDPYINPS